jgi:acyl carrier protein
MNNPAIDVNDLLNLVRRQLGLGSVAATDELVADLGAESIDFQNLISAVEERYHVFIEDREIATITTIADLHRRLLSKLEVSA